MRFAFLAVSGFAGLASTGCAVDAPEDPYESEQQSAALVHVERQESSSHVVARYVRAASVAGEALRATGGAFELPALGQCSPLEGHAGTTPLLPVELVAAGPTSLAQAGTVLELQPRSVPDVSDLVSGFVYSSTARKNAELGPGMASLVLAGVAEPIVVEVPTSLADLEIDGVAAGSNLELGATSSAVQLTWTPSRGAGTEPVVVADVHGAQNAVRCTLEDNGAGELDRAWFGPRGTLVLRRVVHLELEREPFQRIVIDSETSRTLAYGSVR